MDMPSEEQLFAAADATWPAHERHQVGNWIIREGRGGGQRVSAASRVGTVTGKDIDQAEAAQVGLGQEKLFVIRPKDAELDTELAARGYVIKDPVDLLVCSATELAGDFEPRLHAIFAEYPMPMLAEVWAKGGIGPGRLDVMRRATCDKTFVLGRHADKAAGVAYVATSGGICMAHAVEVLASARKQGVAERMMRAAAKWGVWHGAETFCVLTTQANSKAQRLYRKIGMETAGQYHYRIKIA